MLSFILSKLNMLIFAVGIFIVAVMFFQFMEANSINSSAFYLMQTHKTKIESKLNSDSLCAFDSASFPEKLNLGSKGNSIYYSVDFSVDKYGVDNKLVISFFDRTRNPKKPSLIASQQIITDANIILVDGNFIETSSPITSQMVGKQKITLTPSGKETYTIDSYVIIKEIVSGKKNLYIIPCSSVVNNGCKLSAIKMGCYLLWKKDPNGPLKEAAPSCFNALIVLDSSSSSTYTLDRGICKEDSSLWPTS